MAAPRGPPYGQTGRPLTQEILAMFAWYWSWWGVGAHDPHHGCRRLPSAAPNRTSCHRSIGAVGPRAALRRESRTVTSKYPQLPAHLVAIWVVNALVLGALLIVSAASPGRLDDPDLAMQRAGILDVVGPRSPAPKATSEFPALGRVGVVFFVRPEQLADLRSASSEDDGTRLGAAADHDDILG